MIFLDGELIPETLMSVVPAAATDVLSVDVSTEILTECNCSNVTVRNITAGAITVNTASVIVDREG